MYCTPLTADYQIHPVKTSIGNVFLLPLYSKLFITAAFPWLSGEHGPLHQTNPSEKLRGVFLLFMHSGQILFSLSFLCLPVFVSKRLLQSSTHLNFNLCCSSVTSILASFAPSHMHVHWQRDSPSSALPCVTPLSLLIRSVAVSICKCQQ